MTTTTAYKFVNWANMTTFQDFINNANASGAGWLFTMIDFLVFIVLLITLSGTYGWESAMLSSGFITIILSLLFAYMGIMNWTITGAFVGLLLIMIIYIMWSNKYD